MNKTILAALLIAAPLNAFAAEYRSDEFNNPDSRVSSMYICAVTGQKEGYEPNAFVILSKFLDKTNTSIEGEHAANLMADSFTWYEGKQGQFNFNGFWHDQCELPFSNIKKFVAE